MNPQEIETQIRDLIRSESNCWTLSDMLFGPNGLFGQLGPTREDRNRVGRSLLFKEAQNRIRAIEQQHAQAFRDEIKKLPHNMQRATGM